MTTTTRKRARARVETLVNVLCAVLLILFALGLLWGWFVQ